MFLISFAPSFPGLSHINLKWQKMTGLFSPSDQPTVGSTATNVDNSPHKINQAIARLKSDEAETKSDHHEVLPFPTDDGSTAGAAAGTLALSGGKLPSDSEGGIQEVDADVYLLSELISLGVNKASDVNWDDLRFENSQERWYDLLEEWQSSMDDDSLLALPVSEIAQLIFERKSSAQRAAETVEAVDLPPPESLQPRDTEV